MFITALFTIAKDQKQPKCPLGGGWLNELQYIHTVKYIKENAWIYIRQFLICMLLSKKSRIPHT